MPFRLRLQCCCGSSCSTGQLQRHLTFGQGCLRRFPTRFRWWRCCLWEIGHRGSLGLWRRRRWRWRLCGGGGSGGGGAQQAGRLGLRGLSSQSREMAQVGRAPPLQEALVPATLHSPIGLRVGPLCPQCLHLRRSRPCVVSKHINGMPCCELGLPRLSQQLLRCARHCRRRRW